MDISLKLQKTVRENAETLENNMLDLKNWEKDAKEKERKYLNSDNGEKEDTKLKITQSDVDYVKRQFEEGCRRLKEQRYELAVTSFSNAIKRYNQNPFFYVKRAKCYIHLNKLSEAEEDCTKALSIDPKIWKAKFYRSQARELGNNIFGALLDLQDILIMDSTIQIATKAMERLKPVLNAEYAKNGITFDDDEEEEEESTPKQKKQELILVSLAGKDDSSDDDYDRTDEQKINDANMAKANGNKYVSEKCWDKAIEEYSLAIMLNPSDPIYYGNRAWCFIQKNQQERAIIDCCMAITKDPRYVKAYMRRAEAKKQINDFWGARQDLKHVITLEPKNIQAITNLEELNILMERKAYGGIE